MSKEQNKAPIKTSMPPEFEDDDDDSDLTARELDMFRQRLIDERDRVRDRLQRHLSEAVGNVDQLPDEMDQASRETDQAYLLRLADKEKKLLGEIDRALAKFDRGSYGVCEGTGELITRKRLWLRPWTRYSIAHKERIEREKGRRLR
jgi:DnaK suppressor protein